MQKDVDVEHIVGEVEDHKLREELPSCHNFLADSEFERARYKFFNYAVETSNEIIVNEKLHHVFNNLKCAAKVNLAFDFILKNIEFGVFRYVYAHENSTLLDRSKLVCFRDDLAKLNDFLSKTDVMEFCSRDRMKTKWRFYNVANLTVVTALLKDVSMGCKGVVVPKPLPLKHTINCLTFEENPIQLYNDNLCLFRALALHLHRKRQLEEQTSEFFYAFINTTEGLNANQFQGVHMNNLPVVEVIVTNSIPLYDFDILNGSITGEIARRSVKKYENTVRLLRYNNHTCHVNSINAVSKPFVALSCNTFFNNASNLERHQTTCSDRAKNLYSVNVYQVPETLFDKFDSFGITYTGVQKIFRNLANFDFESNFCQGNIFRDTNTTTWLSKHIPISVSVS